MWTVRERRPDLPTFAFFALSRPDPLRWAWRLLTSVRFALWLIGLVALACLAGTLLPQVPREMRGDPAAVQAWVAFQETRFGVLVWPLYRAGLFTVFSTPWFAGTLALLVASVSVCTWNRFLPVWRTVVRPPRRVPDTFFERARHRAGFPLPAGGVAEVEDRLCRRHFQVRRFETPAATYLFADRFAWAQFGTFASHLSLILLLAGALVSLAGTVEQRLTIAEGETGGLFSPASDRHLQVRVDAAVARFDDAGNPRDFRSHLTLLRNGAAVAQGETTVNDPLRYGGFTFHQSTLESAGAAVRVRDSATGNTLFRETLNLNGAIPTPVVELRRADAVLYRGPYVPTAAVVDRIRQESGIFLRLDPTGAGDGPAAPSFVRPDVTVRDWTLTVALLLPGTDRLGASRPLKPGESIAVEDVTVSFREVIGLPAAAVDALPGFPFGAVLQLIPAAEGAPSLLLSDEAGPPLELHQGIVSNVTESLEYTFLGQRAITGITVRRDPGTGLIWVAVALLIGGLAVTFYVPRRRLWLKLTDDRIAVAGQAASVMDFKGEMDRLLGSRE
ncbi:MAG: cytochrome c biogenesis protein ResB [Dehalococcoidia bacterium]